MFLVNICYVSTRSIPLIVYIEFFSLILTIYNLLLSPPPSPILICRWWLLLRLEYSSETRFFFSAIHIEALNVSSLAIS